MVTTDANPNVSGQVAKNGGHPVKGTQGSPGAPLEPYGQGPTKLRRVLVSTTRYPAELSVLNSSAGQLAWW